jgi:hypothetical protein
MPDHGGRGAEAALHGDGHVALAVDAGEDQDGGFHAGACAECAGAGQYGGVR